MNTHQSAIIPRETCNKFMQRHAEEYQDLKKRRDQIPNLHPEKAYHITILLDHIQKEIQKYCRNELDLAQRQILVASLAQDIKKLGELLNSEKWVTVDFLLGMQTHSFF